jgi:hypothetical protein
MKTSSFFRHPIFQWGLITVLLLFIFYMAGAYWPNSTDYYFTFRPSTEAYLRGGSRLYDTNSLGFFLFPWSLLVFLPTMFFSLNYGEALLNLVSLCGILTAGIAVFNRKRPEWLALLLGVASLHTVDVLIRGNVDGLLAFGVGLGWIGLQKKQPWLMAAGLWLLSTKPINVVLAGVFLLLAIRAWKRRDILIAIGPTLISILASPWISGIDWPYRYYYWMQVNPAMIYLQTSLWRTFALFGIHNSAVTWGVFIITLILGCVIILRSPILTPQLLGFLLAANLLFSPYTLGSHYVILVPAFIVLVQRTRWAYFTWLLTLTPLLRMVYGFGFAPIDILYPAALFIWLGIILVKDYQQGKSISPIKPILINA